MSDLGAVIAAYINNLHDMGQRGINFGYDLELQRQANEAAMARTIANAMNVMERQRLANQATILNSISQGIAKGEVDPTVTAAVLNAIRGQGLIDEGAAQFIQGALEKSEESRRLLADSMSKIIAGISAARGEPLPPETVENMRLGFYNMPPKYIAMMFSPMAQKGTTINVGPQKTPETIMAMEGAKQAAISGIKSLDKEIEGIYNAYNSMVESAKMLGDENIVKEMDPENLQRIMESYQRGYRGAEAIQRAMATFTNDEDRARADIFLNAARAINLMQTVPGMKGQISNYEDKMFEGFGTGRFNTAEGLTAFILTAKARSSQMRRLYEVANDINNLRQKMSFGRYSAEELDLLQSEIREKLDYLNELKKKAPYEFLTGKQQEYLRNFYGKLNEESSPEQSQQPNQQPQQLNQQQNKPTRKNIIGEDNLKEHARGLVLSITGEQDINKAKDIFLSELADKNIEADDDQVRELIGGNEAPLRDVLLSEDVPEENKIKLIALLLYNLYRQNVPAGKRKRYSENDYDSMAQYWLGPLMEMLKK